MSRVLRRQQGAVRFHLGLLILALGIAGLFLSLFLDWLAPESSEAEHKPGLFGGNSALGIGQPPTGNVAARRTANWPPAMDEGPVAFDPMKPVTYVTTVGNSASPQPGPSQGAAQPHLPAEGMPPVTSFGTSLGNAPGADKNGFDPMHPVGTHKHIEIPKDPALAELKVPVSPVPITTPFLPGSNAASN